MALGKFFQCGGCGYTVMVNLECPPEEVEEQENKLIAVDGWRYVKAWNSFICPNCLKNGLDPLYLAYAGKPKIENKANSYKTMIAQVIQQIMMFKELGMGNRIGKKGEENDKE